MMHRLSIRTELGQEMINRPIRGGFFTGRVLVIDLDKGRTFLESMGNQLEGE